MFDSDSKIQLPDLTKWLVQRYGNILFGGCFFEKNVKIDFGIDDSQGQPFPDDIEWKTKQEIEDSKYELTEIAQAIFNDIKKSIITTTPPPSKSLDEYEGE